MNIRSRKLSVPIWLQFSLLSLAWGSSFLFIKVGLAGLSPMQVVLARLVFGALTLVAVSLFTRSKLPRELKTWWHLTVVAVLLCVVPFSLFAWSEQHISSGLASILNATTPLMTMMVALAALATEARSLDRLLGLALGFLGVLVLIAPWAGLGQTDLLGQLACLAATLSYGLAFNYLRRYVTPLGLPAVSVATMHVGIGAVIMVALCPMIAAEPIHISGSIIVSMVVLGIAGTGFAYIWNTNIVGSWGATNASTVTYVSPIVGVALGAIVLGEGLEWHHPVGAVIIFFGIACSQGRVGALVGKLRRDRDQQEAGNYQI